MKFKLDENLGRRGKDLLTASGHDVATIYEQRLGNPLRFDPRQYSGIVVLKLPSKPAQADLMIAILTLAKAIETESIEGHLWIVERARIRIYRPDS